MNQLVVQIQGLSGNNVEDLKQLKNLLSKNDEQLVKNCDKLDEFLASLDPATQSLGYMYFLWGKSHVQRFTDPNRFIGQCVRFLLESSPDQVRLAPTKLGKIARRFTEVAVETKQALRAVQPLRAAVAKIRASPDQLTPVHADYLQVCLLAKLYKAGAALIEDELVDIDPSTTGMTPRDALRYFYYAGMVLVGLKEFRKALEYLKLAWTAPAVCLSAIMLEAYKKYLLLALLVHGQVPQPPKYVSSMVQRHLKAACPQYLEFAAAYTTRSTDELHKVGAQHIETFTKDRNFGLVRQVITSLYRRNIQRSTQTYLTISLADIAESVKLPNAKEAEKRILRMIEAGEVFATISQKNGMVSFHEDPEKFDTLKTTRVIDASLHRIMELGAKVRKVDEIISSSTAYLQRTAVHERGARGGPGWGGEEMDEMMLGMVGERPPGMQM